MALFQIGNENITIQADSMGAELKSLKKTTTGVEYMWCADPLYWKRTSPVLFPLVGALNGGKYKCGGKVYEMGQHGLARDMEFKLKSQTNREMWFSLKADAASLEKYPYKFLLEIGYELNESTVIVKWKVTNSDNKDMFFSIGGHPAFRCPIAEDARQGDYRLWFDTKEKITSGIVVEGGLLGEKRSEYELENGYLWIDEHLFDDDALVIENDQVHKVALVSPDGAHYLTVDFDAPLFGVWSPPHKNAPFVCIEPWYGRCDKVGYNGTWEEREWGQKLAPGQTFEASYRITV